MPFSPQQTEQILSVVNTNWRNEKCEICLTDDPSWDLIDEFVAPPVITTVPTLRTVGTLPLLGFVCRVCGHIRFLSAMKLGLYPSTPPTPGQILGPEGSPAQHLPPQGQPGQQLGSQGPPGQPLGKKDEPAQPDTPRPKGAAHG